MKKLLKLFLVILAIAFLSGCGHSEPAKVENQEEIKIPNPISDPGGYTPGMIDLKKKMENDINKATNIENSQRKKILNE